MMLREINVVHILIRSPSQLKQCSHVDPDNKECLKLFKSTRNFQKAIERARQFIVQHHMGRAIESLNEASRYIAYEFKGMRRLVMNLLCTCHLELKNATQAYKSCTDALNLDPQNIELLINRAEANILNEDYEAARRDYQQAYQIDSSNTRVFEGIQKVARLLRNSKRKDYYKVLGVSRDATKRDIKKAFRKLALEWHPDKYQGDDLQKSEKRMADINAAYEVLSNDGKETS